MLGARWPTFSTAEMEKGVMQMDTEAGRQMRDWLKFWFGTIIQDRDNWYVCKIELNEEKTALWPHSGVWLQWFRFWNVDLSWLKSTKCGSFQSIRVSSWVLQVVSMSGGNQQHVIFLSFSGIITWLTGAKPIKNWQPIIVTPVSLYAFSAYFLYA